MSRARKRPRSTEPARTAPTPARLDDRRRRLARTAVVLAIVGALAWLAWQRSRPSATKSPGQAWNLLLVTLDTTRADRLGAYGYAGARTRYLDRLAHEGVRFDQAHTIAPITLPAHASLLTALPPTVHGVRNNGNFYLPERFPTLATSLHERGYATSAFVSAFVLDRRYGLARGFDTYDDRMEGATPQIVSLEAERRGDRTALALSAWLRAHAAQSPSRPFFTWLHLYDAHEPYAPPQPFRQMFAHDAYDGEIAFDDAVLAAVLDTLGQTGLLERTLIAITADHGESLGEHGEETHSMFLYEGALRIPLVLWRPGLLPAGRVIDAPVRLLDIAPTLLDLLGAPALPTAGAAPEMLGRSLRGLIEARDPGPAPPLYAETYLPQLYMNWAPLRALRDARFKLIEAPRPELYDLRDDPGEQRNLYAVEARRAEAMQAALQRLAAGVGSMSVGALDRESAEKLAALGYLGAATGASTSAAPSATARKDPKDVIGIFNRLRRANSAVRERRFDEALPALREVLREDPENAFALLVTGSAHMGTGRWREALPWYRRYLEHVPTSAYAHHWLAICHLRLGEADAALREAEAALVIDPRFSDARVLKGGVLAARGQHAQAVVELRQAIATDPAKPMLRLDLAKVLAEAGRRDEARAEYDALLRLVPDDPAALTGQAAFLAEQGDLTGAERGLRRALTLQPDDVTARFNLAEVLARLGRGGEARAEWQRVLAHPQATPALQAAARRALAGGR